jgi:peroxin-6
MVLCAAAWNTGPTPSEHPHPMTPQYYLTEIATQQDVEVLVSRADFEEALKTLVPSVSQSEMEQYARVQRRYSQTGGNTM